MTTYKITATVNEGTKGDVKEVRLIEAKTLNQAIAHVAKDTIVGEQLARKVEYLDHRGDELAQRRLHADLAGDAVISEIPVGRAGDDGLHLTAPLRIKHEAHGVSAVPQVAVVELHRTPPYSVSRVCARACLVSFRSCNSVTP